MKSINLTINVYAGGEVRKAIEEMVTLASQLNIDVWGTLNDVNTLARPGDDPEKVYEAFLKEVTSNHKYKYASS